MTLPATMIAIAISSPGGPEVLEPTTASLPVVGESEVLVRVAAAGVNGPDLAQRRGHYDPPPGASPYPGLEIAGEIVALGKGATGFVLGQQVMALTNGGGYAEYAAVPHGQVLPVPARWSMIEAAALPETFFTITQTLVMRAGLTAGMSVLVHGGSGGIGGAAIMIAKAVGARAIAVVSTPEKARYAESLGADLTIDRTTEDVLERTLDLTEGRGIDRIVDLLGGETTADNIKASARGGHIVQISTLLGQNAEVPLRLMMARDVTISGSTLRPQTAATKAAIANRIRNDIFPALEAPACPKPAIARFALADAASAHRTLESGDSMGKLVLVTAWGEGQIAAD